MGEGLRIAIGGWFISLVNSARGWDAVVPDFKW